MPTDAEHDRTAKDGPGTLLTQVSNTMVRLYKRQFGHGPARARTYWAGPNALVCILDGTLAAEERSLVKIGGHQRLRDTRTAMQYAMIGEYCRPVEQLTGRKLEAFHSSCDVEADGQSVEMFVFHPPTYHGPSRVDRAVPQAG